MSSQVSLQVQFSSTTTTKQKQEQSKEISTKIHLSEIKYLETISSFSIKIIMQVFVNSTIRNTLIFKMKTFSYQIQKEEKRREWRGYFTKFFTRPKQKLKGFTPNLHIYTWINPIDSYKMPQKKKLWFSPFFSSFLDRLKSASFNSKEKWK